MLASIKNKDPEDTENNGYQSYPLFISTTETTIGLISKKCEEQYCHIDQPYNSDLSKTYKSSVRNNIDSERSNDVAVYKTSNHLMQEVNFTG